MRKILLLAAITLFSLPILAQQSVAAAAAAARAKNANQDLPANAATREQVMAFLELTQARRNMVAVMDNMKQIMRQSAEESFREKVPNPTPKQLEALRGLFDDIDVPLDEMINAIVPIYQRHFTTADLDELIRFYSSPVGQKLLHEQPQLLQESMRAGAAIQQKRMDEIKAKIRERIEKLIEAGDDGNAPRQ
jgi:hypothetical protein